MIGGSDPYWEIAWVFIDPSEVHIDEFVNLFYNSRYTRDNNE